MSPPLLFGIPAKTGMLCSNAVCKEYAEFVVRPPGGNPDVPFCTTHLPREIGDGNRLIKLKTPGEPNQPDATSTTPTA